jgi:hypothetical protein
MYYIWSDKERNILQLVGGPAYKNVEDARLQLTNDESKKEEITTGNVETLEKWEEVKTFVLETEPLILKKPEELLAWSEANGTRLV